jgi:NlpC/P60 family protein
MSVEANFKISLHENLTMNHLTNGLNTTGRNYLIEINGVNYDHTNIPLNKTIVKINMYISTSQALSSPVNLPEQLNKNLMKFLEQGRPASPYLFTCHQFIDFLFDKYNISNERSVSKKNWNFIQFEQNKLITGTVVLLSKNGLTKHSALYLGHDQYISLFGSTGPIIINNLQELKTLFDSEDVQILEPKNDDCM